MPRLFTYCLRVDDGAAPNPFWGLCTLVICKPVIRRTADVGDWVVGTGSKNVEGRNFSNMLVYAMRVSEVMTMEEYDEFARSKHPEKIPDWTDVDGRRRVGDAIYDYSGGGPTLRRSVHVKENRERDLRGLNALVSDHFYYFGREPKALPQELLFIVRQGQGHQVNKNERYVASFVDWMEGLGVKPNSILGMPQHEFPSGDDSAKCGCAALEEADADERVATCPECGAL